MSLIDPLQKQIGDLEDYKAAFTVTLENIRLHLESAPSSEN